MMVGAICLAKHGDPSETFKHLLTPVRLKAFSRNLRPGKRSVFRRQSEKGGRRAYSLVTFWQHMRNILQHP